MMQISRTFYYCHSSLNLVRLCQGSLQGVARGAIGHPETIARNHLECARPVLVSSPTQTCTPTASSASAEIVYKTAFNSRRPALSSERFSW